MIKVIAKKTGKYENKRHHKGEAFEIVSERDFNVKWMTHAPNQTQKAQQEIIALAKRFRDGIKHS